MLQNKLNNKVKSKFTDGPDRIKASSGFSKSNNVVFVDWPRITFPDQFISVNGSGKPKVTNIVYPFI